MKYIPEIGAIIAAVTLGYSLDMTFVQTFILWIGLDLMTVSRKQIQDYKEKYS